MSTSSHIEALEISKSTGKRIPSSSSVKQLNIENMTDQSTKVCYRMFVAVYKLALNLIMSLNQLQTLCNVMTKNNVNLIAS